MANRKEITIETYNRVRYGKPEQVITHTKNIRISDIDEKTKERIKLGKAKNLFEDRSERSRKMDIRQDSKKMFAFPNRLWYDTPNRYDVWGLDGFVAPEVKDLPERGLPFQVVTFKNEIYTADAKGIYNAPEIVVIELDHSPETQEQYEKETGKNAIWHDKTTKGYKNWLKKNSELEEIADRLNYNNLHRNKLYKIKELYESLNLSKEDEKEMILKLYNKTHKRNIGSYTKTFWEFYNHIYEDELDRKINSETRKQKDRMKDPKKAKQQKERYKTSELRFLTLKKNLDKNGYQYDSVEVRGKMKYLENDEIIGDIKAQQSEETGDIGSNEVDWEVIDKVNYQEMAEHYEQKTHDDYFEYLQQEASA